MATETAFHILPCYAAQNPRAGRLVLVELRVENYAVIDQLAVEFAPGLNLVTGETGAGKSLLIDALALLLGEKASADVVRHGCDKAVLSAAFAPEGKRAAKLLDELGLEASDGGEIIVRREIASNGKGRVFVNNQPATVAVLRQLAPELAVVHAQNESLASFDTRTRLELLDQFANADTALVAHAFARWKEISGRLGDLQRDEQDRLRMLDLWSFQKNEIEAAQLESGEDERLEGERCLLGNAEKLYGAAMGAYDALYESGASAASSLRNAARSIEELARYDERFRESLAQLESARITVDDVSATLRDFADKVNASPERLAEVEDRLAAIERLKRKYGRTVADVIAYHDEVSRKLNEIENHDELIQQLRAELAHAAKQYFEAAEALSSRRHAAANELEKLVEAEVNELAMKVRFQVAVLSDQAEQNWTAAGFDSVAFLICTNAGEPLRPLEQIASGGELSRVMLALKVVVERGSSKSAAGPNGNIKSLGRTLVFDEIDTGIGGRAAEAVGKKLKALARRNQVLCVTHLPQIASFADHHHLISKRETAGRVRTSVRLLSAAERAEEVARMMSGAKVTDTSLKHAEQLLKANA